MQYIVFDLEFNQDFPSLQANDGNISQYPYEIIQIGAIKLDQQFKTVNTYNRYVKPVIYTQISSFVTEITGITTDQLQSEKLFPEIFHDFMSFIGDSNSILCTWGMSDVKELYRNTIYHNLDSKKLPSLSINLQPYASLFLELPKNKLLSLQFMVEALGILTPFHFHNALYDAYYTAEIFKKIYSPAMQPIKYDINYVKPRPRQRKKVIDIEGIVNQFEKMYSREISEEEKKMILLAYKMGKTNQFLKET